MAKNGKNRSFLNVKRNLFKCNLEIDKILNGKSLSLHDVHFYCLPLVQSLLSAKEIVVVKRLRTQPEDHSLPTISEATAL